MPSLLNDSSRPEEFSLNNIEVLVDNKEQNWFKWAYVGKNLGLVYVYRSTERSAGKDQKTWLS